MENPTSIKQLIQRLMPRQPEIVMGQVLSSDPLSVQIVNDEKQVLSSKMITVPGRITGLQTGELVHILVYNSGKKYYLLDRR